MDNKFIPSRLTDARIEMGLTQTELAEKCDNCSRITISNLEHGFSEPKDFTLQSINKVLQKSISYYYTPESTDIIGESPIIFRSFNSKTVLQRNQTMIIKKKIASIVQYIFSQLKALPINIDEKLFIEDPLDLEDNKIEDLALKLRHYWQLNNNPINNLAVIVENNGIICSSISLPSRIDAFNFNFSLKHNMQKCIVIVYKKDSSYFRQRFDIAHELGHILLHSFLDENEIQINHKKLENQANKFASAFLMPSNEFKYSIHNLNFPSLIEAKKLWGASLGAIIYRLKDLKLISERQYRNLNIEISRKKWRTIEPLDKETQKEKPYLIGEAFKFLFKSNYISPIVVSRQTALSFEELNNFSGIYDLFKIEQFSFNFDINYKKDI